MRPMESATACGDGKGDRSRDICRAPGSAPVLAWPSPHFSALRPTTLTAAAAAAATPAAMDGDAEQTRRLLLADHDDDGEDGEEEEEDSDGQGQTSLRARLRWQRRRRGPWWPTAGLGGVLIFGLAVLASMLTLLSLVKIGLFDALRVVSGVSDDQPPPPASSAASSFLRRPDADFVLDSRWDYAAPPTVRTYNWVIANAEGNPDGIFRSLTLINGKFPGELVRCNDGDTLVIHVENRAANATAIHWHGLFQNGTNHMDGTPGATQCPIAPGRSFRYEFTVRGQAGTYFYHGHQGADAMDGLVGPLVIHSPQEQLYAELGAAYQSDRVVMVQDWYHDAPAGLLRAALEPGSEAPPMPNGALINGANVVNCSQYPGRRCETGGAGVGADGGPRLAGLDLQAGVNHRLRFINAGALAWFEITIDRHHHRALRLTEIDGVAIVPSPEASVLIAPGQRYSVVVSANQTSAAKRAADADADSFWLRARIATHCFSENALAHHDNPVALAVVRYVTADGGMDTNTVTDPAPPRPLPTTTDDSGAFSVVCRDMHPNRVDSEGTPSSLGGSSGGSGSGNKRLASYAPIPPRAAPAYAHHSYFLRVNLEIGNWRLQRGFFNSSSYRPNLESPALHRAVDGLRADNASFAVTGINTAAFDAISELVIGSGGDNGDDDVQVVDLVLQNFDEGSHPLHLHGHQMFVLGAGHGYFPGYEALGLASEGKGVLLAHNGNANSTAAAVLVNPVRRDVATVEGFGWTLLRIVADNPGVWKFHCHMLFHGEGAGMALLLLSRIDRLRSWSIPAANRALCEDATSEELYLGAAPDDSIWYGHHNG